MRKVTFEQRTAASTVAAVLIVAGVVTFATRPDPAPEPTPQGVVDLDIERQEPVAAMDVLIDRPDVDVQVPQPAPAPTLPPAEPGEEPSFYQPVRTADLETLEWWLFSVGLIWNTGDIGVGPDDISIPGPDELVAVWSDPAQTTLDPADHQTLTTIGADLATVEHTGLPLIAYGDYFGLVPDAEIEDPDRAASNSRIDPETAANEPFRGWEILGVQADVGPLDGWAWVGVVWSAEFDPHRFDGPVGYDMALYPFEQQTDGQWVPRACWTVPPEMGGACGVQLGAIITGDTNRPPVAAS
jgi:hypothetical protein